jgi:hypothetical protein
MPSNPRFNTIISRCYKSTPYNLPSKARKKGFSSRAQYEDDIEVGSEEFSIRVSTNAIKSPLSLALLITKNEQTRVTSPSIGALQKIGDPHPPPWQKELTLFEVKCDPG